LIVLNKFLNYKNITFKNKTVILKLKKWFCKLVNFYYFLKRKFNLFVKWYFVVLINLLKMIQPSDKENENQEVLLTSNN